MVEFNPNWNTDAVYHHLTPQTYLRAWKHNASSVYYVEKDSSIINEDLNRNTKRLAGIKNYFTRNVRSLFRMDNDCDQYFKPLKSYKIIYLDKELILTVEMHKHYWDFSNWAIYDNSGQLISDDLKGKIKSAIECVEIKDIEVGWAKIYEDGWPRLREDIERNILDNQDQLLVESVGREELVKFMVSLEWRTRPIHPEIHKYYDSISNIEVLKVALDEKVENGNYEFLSTERELMLHNILLKYYYLFLNNKGIIYKEAKIIIENMNIEFLLAEDGSEFITSDNPVCRYYNELGKLEYVFPVTPKIACAIRNAGTNFTSKYIITKLNKKNVFSYNIKLKENSYKGYILKEPNLEVYFG